MNDRPSGRFPVRGKLRIRTRLLVALLALAALLIAVPTVFLEAQARRSLEAELAARLESVAAAASQQIDPSLVAPLLSLGPESGRERARA